MKKHYYDIKGFSHDDTEDILFQRTQQYYQDLHVLFGDWRTTNGLSIVSLKSLKEFLTKGLELINAELSSKKESLKKSIKMIDA